MVAVVVVAALTVSMSSSTIGGANPSVTMNVDTLSVPSTLYLLRSFDPSAHTLTTTHSHTHSQVESTSSISASNSLSVTASTAITIGGSVCKCTALGSELTLTAPLLTVETGSTLTADAVYISALSMGLGVGGQGLASSIIANERTLDPVQCSASVYGYAQCALSSDPSSTPPPLPAPGSTPFSLIVTTLSLDVTARGSLQGANVLICAVNNMTVSGTVSAVGLGCPAGGGVGAGSFTSGSASSGAGHGGGGGMDSMKVNAGGWVYDQSDNATW